MRAEERQVTSRRWSRGKRVSTERHITKGMQKNQTSYIREGRMAITKGVYRQNNGLDTVNVPYMSWCGDEAKSNTG